MWMGLAVLQNDTHKCYVFFFSSLLFPLDGILVWFAALNLLVDCLQKHTNVISIFSRQNVHCNIKLVLSQHPILCAHFYFNFVTLALMDISCAHLTQRIERGGFTHFAPRMSALARFSVTNSPFYLLETELCSESKYKQTSKMVIRTKSKYLTSINVYEFQQLNPWHANSD